MTFTIRTPIITFKNYIQKKQWGTISLKLLHESLSNTSILDLENSETAYFFQSVTFKIMI